MLGRIHAGGKPHDIAAILIEAGLSVGSAGGSHEVAAIRSALLDDAQDTRDASGPAREEVPGTGGLGHRGTPALFFSERGHGKSFLLVTVGLGAAAKGEKVLYLDRENGAALTRERVEAILDAHEDWGDPLADGRFVGRHYPELRADWQPEAFGEALAGEGFTVVIFDSVREMLVQLGLDPHRDDVSPFLNLAVTPLVRRGTWVALLDNVGHEHTHRPKRDGGKLDAIPQAYKLLTVETSRRS